MAALVFKLSYIKPQICQRDLETKTTTEMTEKASC
jgi:hypothetical protein